MENYYHDVQVERGINVKDTVRKRFNLTMVFGLAGINGKGQLFFRDFCRQLENWFVERFARFHKTPPIICLEEGKLTDAYKDLIGGDKWASKNVQRVDVLIKVDSLGRELSAFHEELEHRYPELKDGK